MAIESSFPNPLSKAQVPEKAVLVGLVTRAQRQEQMEEYLAELEFLAETAGAETLKHFWQRLDFPDQRTYVGKGKLEEIKAYVDDRKVDMVIFDDEISPSQQRNLEEVLQVKVLDRPMLILDIFAHRAQTVQARTQVELAQMQYLLPRLRGMWTHLDRVKGGIGMRGSGESEIETDRRMAKERIAKLKQQLVKIDRQNETQRKNRGELIRVSLVGYTNVGKSTLMRILSKSDVFAENKLFATLDTTVRKVVLETTPFLLSDTVGFIRKLPHHLVESFKSTLDEVRESDILLHVVDIAHPQFEDHMTVVQQTLAELGAADKATLVVFNKMDLYEDRYFDPYLPAEEKRTLLEELERTWMNKTHENALFIAAEQKRNVDALKERLLLMVRDAYAVRYPWKVKEWS
ncbi:MAG: GTPase HflX [Bacteroidetes bacterium]|nr:GTPase HflX [Bacteroidota bacterium]